MKLLVLATLFQLALLQTNFRPVVASSFKECDGQRYYTTCGAGAMCQFVQICLGNMQEYKFCPMVDFTKPYCNRGECSETPETFDEECNLPVLMCTGEGIFPDPSICSMYHNCTAVGTMSSVVQCPMGEVFDPDASACKLPAVPEDCMKIKCDVNELFSRYGTSKSFYGYCEMNAGLLSTTYIRIFKCPDGTTFNGKGCSYGCPEVGRFGDSSDPSVYYECYEQGVDAIRNTCPVGKVFDTARKACRTLIA
ncbi:uncharacterized protein LOC120417226 [Culex pipiens pallens]|uniref:uncharacterized protein LOC120417226 n=1 Tax=Culex pipiens pallens TaxID=42434 RepID=UPI0019548A74|nr:uncharacterized protein LOC120417226 [Culex pipiens pallens]